MRRCLRLNGADPESSSGYLAHGSHPRVGLSCRVVEHLVPQHWFDGLASWLLLVIVGLAMAALIKAAGWLVGGILLVLFIVADKPVSSWLKSQPIRIKMIVAFILLFPCRNPLVQTR